MSNPCDILLKDGLMKTRRTFKVEDYEKYGYELLTQNRFSSKKSARSFASSAGLSLPIDGLPIPLTAEGNASYFAKKDDTWSEAFMYENEENTKLYTKFIEETREPSIELAKQVVDCQKFQQEVGGVFAEVEYIGGETDATIYIKFNKIRGDESSTPYFIRKEIAQELLIKGYTLTSHKGKTKINLIHGDEIQLQVTISQTVLAKPQIVNLPIEGNKWYSSGVRVHFARIWEERKTVIRGSNLLSQKFPITGAATTSGERIITFEPLISDNIVITKLRVWLTIGAFDAAPSITHVDGMLTVSDMKGNIWYSGAGVSHRPNGKEVQTIETGDMFFRMEDGEQMQFKVNAVANGNIKYFVLQTELVQ